MESRSLIPYRSLKINWKQIRKQLFSDLGGGAHGHLGLVILAAEYALVSPVPYAIPAGTAQ